MRAVAFCLAFVLASSATAIAQPGDMTFRVVSPPGCVRPCPVTIRADGRIAEDSHMRFRAVASRAPRGAIVQLNSRGGNLLGGILLGLALREQRSAVQVPSGATCASACAYALLGGVERRVAGGQVGVHRFYAVHALTGRRSIAYERAVGAEATALLREYVVSMGASPSLVTLAAGIDPATIHFLSTAELRRYGVVTGAAAGRKAIRVASRTRRRW